MPTVYKYCDARGVRILRNLEFKITPPNQFNDPFEFTPHVICSSPNRRLKNLFKDKQEVREMFLEHKKRGEFTGNSREFRKQLRKIRPSLVSAVASKMPEANQDLQARYLDEMSKHHGVLCMSSRRNSIVMWGHYGDKHRGIVVGFDSSWVRFRGDKGLRPIKYVRERVIWDTSWASEGPQERAYAEQLIFTKNEEWKYEDELRQLFTLRGFPQRSLDDGGVGYFLPFPPEIVLSVSLGTRCAPQLENAVKSILRAPHFSHVKLDRAALHEVNFDLQFV